MKCYAEVNFIGVMTIPKRDDDGKYYLVAILDGLDSRKFFVDVDTYKAFKKVDPGVYLCEFETFVKLKDGNSFNTLNITRICKNDPFYTYAIDAYDDPEEGGE